MPETLTISQRRAKAMSKIPSNDELWVIYSSQGDMNYDQYDKAITELRTAYDERIKELEKEVYNLRNGEGVDDVVQYHLTPELAPVDTNKLGQGAFFLYGILDGLKKRIAELEAENAELKGKVKE
jgi:hypothetical protein